MKVQFGADGAASDVAAAAPLPVQISDGTDTMLVNASGHGLVEVATALPAGTNAIGKLAANSGVDIGDVDVTSIAAGTNVIGATLQVSGLAIENATSVTVKYAVIDAATSGDNTIVAAVGGKKIRVLSCFLVAAGTVNVRFESGASGTALTGQMNLAANSGFVLPHNPHGWFQSGEGALLNLELSGAISVDGSLTYIEAE